MKNILVTLLGLFIGILCANVFAASNAGAFIEKGLHARYAALAQTGTAIVNGPASLYWNPARMKSSPSTHVSVSGLRAYETDHMSLAASRTVPVLGKKFPMAFSYRQSKMDGILRTQYIDAIERFDTTGQQLTYMGAAYSAGTKADLSEKLSIGVAGKLLTESAAGYSASAFGVDLGANYKAMSAHTIAVAMRNVNEPSLKWNTPSKSADKVPWQLFIGHAYQQSSLLISTEWQKRHLRDAFLAMGVEYRLFKLLALRAGLRQRTLSLGTGLTLAPLNLDVSWTKTDFDFIEDEYRFSLQIEL